MASKSPSTMFVAGSIVAPMPSDTGAAAVVTAAAATMASAAVSTSTATQTSDNDVKCCETPTTVDYFYSANLNRSPSSTKAYHNIDDRQTQPTRHNNLREHLISNCQHRMTANNNPPSRRTCRDDVNNKYLPKHKNKRLTTTDEHHNPSVDTMNLRNRPLKAATADANPSQTKLNDSTEKIYRRHSRRHPNAVSARNRHEYSSHSLSTSPQRPSIRNFFPLRTIGSVCELFRSQICPQSSHCSMQIDDNSSSLFHGSDSQLEPDLALLSIVVGIIETNMTKSLYLLGDNDLSLPSEPFDDAKGATLFVNDNRRESGSYSPAEATPAPTVGTSNAINSPLDFHIPTVYYETVSSLLSQFTTQIKESIDLSKYPKKTSRELIKKISDVIWSNLQSSPYKARTPHLQTIFSYLTGNKLDSFGMAYTVVAACQILGLDDVRLVMSEDHAWVMYGDGETCEVTWHGKGTEDKRGQSIPVDSSSWLYLNGNTIVCDRYMTVATLVSAINPAINATSKDSKEIAILQQQLLWILYDYGHLSKYPMALGNLGDLEDSCAYGLPRKEPTDLLNEAIESAKTYYNDSHVYPYTYLGGYFFRIGLYKYALKSWADAAQVLKKYNYTRDDEEIYKEFQEIANDLIPDIVKCHFLVDNSCGSTSVPVTQDPECFSYLLRFYDGLCAWEEGSSTPVLHIGWTQPLVSTISKFTYATRSQVSIKVDCFRLNSFDSDIEDDDCEDGSRQHINTTIGERRRRRAASAGSTSSLNNYEDNIENGHSKLNLQNGNKLNRIEKEDFNDSSSDFETHAKSTNRNIVHTRRSSESSDMKSSYGSESEDDNRTVMVLLTSKKFAGLKNLLTTDKLNTSAIQLQLTAQSQVNVNKRSRSGSNKMNSVLSEFDFVSTTTTTLTRTNGCNKRLRRE